MKSTDPIDARIPITPGFFQFLSKVQSEWNKSHLFLLRVLTNAFPSNCFTTQSSEETQSCESAPQAQFCIQAFYLRKHKEILWYLKWVYRCRPSECVRFLCFRACDFFFIQLLFLFYFCEKQNRPSIRLQIPTQFLA